MGDKHAYGCRQKETGGFGEHLLKFHIHGELENGGLLLLSENPEEIQLVTWKRTD